MNIARLSRCVQFALAVALLWTAGSAQAALISVVPSAATATVGSSFSVEVRISELGGAPLSGYDFSMRVAPGLAGLRSVGFSGALGPPGSYIDGPSSQAFSGGQQINLWAVSGLFDDELRARQASTGFAIATLVFEALAEGIAPFGIELVGLPQSGRTPGFLGAFDPDAFDVEVLQVRLPAPTLVTILPRAVGVPEPDTGALVGALAVAGLLARMRGRGRQRR